MKVKELARALNIPQGEYRQFRAIIRDLLKSGDLVRLKRNRIGLASELEVMVGKISITKSGVGFLLREPEQEDIYIPASHLLTALDGDTVMIRLTGSTNGRPSGTVIKIVKRVDRNIVGVFRRTRHFCYVVPDFAGHRHNILIPPEAVEGARDGEKVVAKVTWWEDPNLDPEGRISERIGFPGEPGVDMLTIIKSYELPEEFPPEVLQEVETAAAMPSPSDLGGRTDLTRECVYTVDPSDAKDHDDAISVTRRARGYRLGVHIADVAYFVRADSALDREAFERGNSVYLPGMVIPMLPEALSNDTCSLKPNRRRLAHSVIIDLDRKGKVLSWKIRDTIIKSRAKLSYEEVQKFFDGEKASARVQRVADNLVVARELALLLSERRFAEGSLDFDLPEAKIILNDRGEVIELGNRVRLESHRLIEEFMLAANRAVALDVFRMGQQFLYRVHGRPDLEKLESFSHMMSRLGHHFPVSPQIKPADFARFLERVKDKPEADFINELMLRSMQKAVYQRENIGHFGLAFSHYTHFTSPIRRYPDLVVHRLMRALREKGRYRPEFARRLSTVIDSVGRHCSETERIAEAAEREAVRVKQVAYMARHVGDEYDGVVTGVTRYGFFVRLDNMGAEGLVRVSTIDDDYYRFDEQRYSLIGRRSGRKFRLGDRVHVGVLKVDRTRNEVDLYLPEVLRKRGKAMRSGKREGKQKKR